MKRSWKFLTWFFATTLVFASCREKEEVENPFIETTSAQGLQTELFAAAPEVPVTGFIDPDIYPDFFSPYLQTVGLGLNETSVDYETFCAAVPADAEVQCPAAFCALEEINCPQTFVYYVYVDENGELQILNKGVGNINPDGFWEMNIASYDRELAENGEIPRSFFMYYNSGLPFGTRAKGVFNAPSYLEVTSGLKEDSALIHHTDANHQAGDTILDALEQNDDFKALFTTGVNALALQSAGAVMQQTLADTGDLPSAADVALYTTQLVSHMAAINSDFSTSQVDPNEYYARATTTAYAYDTILTGINAQKELSVGHRSERGHEIIQTGLTTISSTRQADPNFDVAGSIDVDSLAQPRILNSALKVHLEGLALRNLTGDNSLATRTMNGVLLDSYTDATAIKTNLQGYFKNVSAGAITADMDGRRFYDMVESIKQDNAQEAMQFGFNGMSDENKTLFQDQYTAQGGIMEVYPNRLDEQRYAFLTEKCETAFQGTVWTRDEYLAHLGGSSSITLEDETVLVCHYVDATDCNDTVGAVGDTGTIDAVGDYNYYSSGNTDKESCKFKDVHLIDPQASGYEKNVSTSLYMDSDIATQMGAAKYIQQDSDGNMTDFSLFFPIETPDAGP